MASSFTSNQVFYPSIEAAIAAIDRNEERLAAIEIGKLMLLGQRFRPRQEQASGFRLVTGLPRRGTVHDRDDLRDRVGRLGQN